MTLKTLRTRVAIVHTILGYDEGLEQCNKAIIINDLKYIEPSVDDLLETCSIELEKDSLEYKRFCREMLKTWVNIYQIEKERILGNYDNDYNKAGKEGTSMMSVLSDTIKRDAKKETMTLSTAIKHYINEKADSWVHKTKLENEHIFKLVLEIIGDKDVADLTRLDFITYRDPLKYYLQIMRKKKSTEARQFRRLRELLKTRVINLLVKKH
jgi:hypothetical protein